MKYQLSVCLPAIRTIFWQNFYDTLKEACKKYTWEVVFAGPFDPPASLAGESNVKFIKTYARPTTASHMAVDACEGELWFNGADDAKFVPDSIDKAMDLWHSVGNPKAIVNMRYTEWEAHAGNTYDEGWWYARRHPPLQKPGIPGDYRMLLNPLMSVKYFRELGGFDCAYEYPNFNIHDFAFRAQYDGAPVFLSPTDVMNCDHYGTGSPMGIADHYPIETAYWMDKGRFDGKYNREDALRPDTVKLDWDHWKNYTEPWGLRFRDQMYSSYEEMLAARGVKV